MVKHTASTWQEKKKGGQQAETLEKARMDEEDERKSCFHFIAVCSSILPLRDGEGERVAAASSAHVC